MLRVPLFISCRSRNGAVSSLQKQSLGRMNSRTAGSQLPASELYASFLCFSNSRDKCENIPRTQNFGEKRYANERGRRSAPGRKASPTMTKLYGEVYATKVNDRLEDLDSGFAEMARDAGYEMFWARQGLSLRDKALITVTTLIALGKEEQSRIHIHGFFNAGGTEQELRAAILHLAVYAGFPVAMNGFRMLNEVLKTIAQDNAK